MIWIRTNARLLPAITASALLLIAATALGETQRAPTVLGLDPLAARMYADYKRWKDQGNEQMAKGSENLLKAFASPISAAAAMKKLRLSPEHAKYHPHATEHCDLLRGWNPGDQFDVIGHTEEIISESTACPICNPREGSSTETADPSAENAKVTAERTAAQSGGRFYASAQVAVGEWVEIAGTYDVASGTVEVTGVAGKMVTVSTGGEMTFEVPVGPATARISLSVDRLAIAVGKSFEAGKVRVDLEVGREYRILNPVELAKHGLLGDAFDPSKRPGTGSNRDITDEDVQRVLSPK